MRYGQAVCGDLEIARDAVQEAFLRYYIALREGTTSGEARGWLYSTTRNYILDRLKECFVQNSESLNAALRLAEDAPDPEDRILLSEIDANAHSLLTARESSASGSETRDYDTEISPNFWRSKQPR